MCAGCVRPAGRPHAACHGVSRCVTVPGLEGVVDLLASETRGIAVSRDAESIGATLSLSVWAICEWALCHGVSRSVTVAL